MSLQTALRDDEFRKDARAWAELPMTRRILRLYREDTLRPIPTGGDLNARLVAAETANGERKAIDRMLSLSAPEVVSSHEEADYGRRDALKAELNWTDEKIDEMIAQEKEGPQNDNGY